MKKDWNKIIDQYVNDELSPKEKEEFEKELKVNEALKKEYELFLTTVEVVKRNSLRQLLKQAKASYYFKKYFLRGGLLVASLAAVLTVGYFITNSKNIGSVTISPQEAFIQNMKDYAPFNKVQPEYFKFDGKPNVFLSKTGTMVSVTKNSFELNGKPYHGKAIVQYQEAKTPSSIVSAGLSTMAGDSLLETQGMFSLSAFTPAGKKLALSKEGVYIQAPVDTVIPGMKLFTGVPQPNGDVNWTNPVALERIPIQKKMSDINLFPQTFVDALNKMRWSKSKKKRDSLYLSFGPKIATKNVKFRLKVGGVNTEQKVKKNLFYKEYQFIKGNISPTKVLSIWNSKFNNTILSTREFEERMQYIHRTCSQKVLDAYINNLDKPLWKIDQMVVDMGYPQFQQFVDQHVGGVSVGSQHQKNLNAFYQASVKRLKALGIKRIEEAVKKRERMQKKLNAMTTQNQIRNGILKQTNNAEETALNLKNASDKLGLSKKDKQKAEDINNQYQRADDEIRGTNDYAYTSNVLSMTKQVSRASYGFRMSSKTQTKQGGKTYNICNIDGYVRNVRQMSRARKSLTINNPKNGRSTTIAYRDFSVKVNQSKQYKMLYMYCFPDKLQSYVRVDAKNGKIDYSLNQNINYSAIIVGINENGFFYKKYHHLPNKVSHPVTLKAISKNKFDHLVNRLNRKAGTNKKDVSKELNWLFKVKENYKELELQLSNKAFREKIEPTIFPCWNETTVSKIKRSPVYQDTKPIEKIPNRETPNE